MAQKLIKILPKWPNFAKSGHTGSADPPLFPRMRIEEMQYPFYCSSKFKSEVGWLSERYKTTTTTTTTSRCKRSELMQRKRFPVNFNVQRSMEAEILHRPTKGSHKKFTLFPFMWSPFQLNVLAKWKFTRERPLSPLKTKCIRNWLRCESCRFPDWTASENIFRLF